MAFAQVATHLAVAVPFLLLSSCRSLHVMEDGHDRKETLIFGAHHKTGTVLVTAASRCFDSSFRYTLDPHWKAEPLGPHDRVVHLIRNPISLALSAYLYHKETGEDWTLTPGVGMQHLESDPFLRKFLLNVSESYTEFLRRVGAPVGIRAEIAHLVGELGQIEFAEKFCGTRSRCMQICLEDFTASSSSYDASWRKVMSFWGKNITQHMQHCLSKADLNRNPDKHARHVTSNSLSEKRYNFLRNIVVEVDADVYNGRLKKMGEGGLDCGGPNFLETHTGLNVADGGAYTGWFIEEEYA